MTQVIFRFFAGLNDFLADRHHQRLLTYKIQGNPSVKDAIEALGVPHTEVSLIRINGKPRSFEALLQDDDEITVYPPFTQLSPDKLTNPFASQPPDPVRFIADVHLGKLAASLRMLGFDTAFGNEIDDEDLARRSRRENRILLTRDLGLLKRNQVQYGYYLRATDPDLQIVEVLHRYHLIDFVQPFQRCSRCNGLIHSVNKVDIQRSVPPGVFEEQSDFRQCGNCGQVYWKGSHYDRLLDWVAEVKEAVRSTSQPSL